MIKIENYSRLVQINWIENFNYVYFFAKILSGVQFTALSFCGQTKTYTIYWKCEFG